VRSGGRAAPTSPHIAQSSQRSRHASFRSSRSLQVSIWQTHINSQAGVTILTASFSGPTRYAGGLNVCWASRVHEAPCLHISGASRRWNTHGDNISARRARLFGPRAPAHLCYGQVRASLCHRSWRMSTQLLFPARLAGNLSHRNLRIVLMPHTLTAFASWHVRVHEHPYPRLPLPHVFLASIALSLDEGSLRCLTSVF
jgi:hypothetical protein